MDGVFRGLAGLLQGISRGRSLREILSVQFRSNHTDPSVQFRKANTDPSMQFRWGHTEFLFRKMLDKNLDESVRQLSFSQTSPGKSSCQDAFGKSLCNALSYCQPSDCHLKTWQPYINKLTHNFDSFRYIFNMQCLFCIQSPIYYAMLCHVMSCHVLYHVPCAIQRHLATETKSSAPRHL